MRENAAKTISYVLNRLEGGGKVVNHKSDPGKLTKWGFSQRWNPDLNVAALDEATASKLALERYWAPSGADDVTWPWDAMIFDCAFNFGLDDVKAIQKCSPSNWQDFLLMRMCRHINKSGMNAPALLVRCVRLYNWVRTQKD